jgi:hypothetical protein
MTVGAYVRRHQDSMKEDDPPALMVLAVVLRTIDGWGVSLPEYVDRLFGRGCDRKECVPYV